MTAMDAVLTDKTNVLQVLNAPNRINVLRISALAFYNAGRHAVKPIVDHMQFALQIIT